MGLRFIVVFFRLPGALRLNKILALSSLRNLIWFLSRLWANLKLLSMFMIIYFLLLVGVRFSYSSQAYSIFNQVNTMPLLEKNLNGFCVYVTGRAAPAIRVPGQVNSIKKYFIFFALLIYTALIILYHYVSRIFFSLSYSPTVKTRLKRNYYNNKKLFYFSSLAIFNVLILALT